MPFFQYDKSEKYKIDMTKNVPIQTIVSHNKDGKFIPLYIKYIDNDQSEYTYKIEAIKYIREYDNKINFCCTIQNDGRLLEIILSFHINECLWTLYA